MRSRLLPRPPPICTLVVVYLSNVNPIVLYIIVQLSDFGPGYSGLYVLLCTYSFGTVCSATGVHIYLWNHAAS